MILRDANTTLQCASWSILRGVNVGKPKAYTYTLHRTYYSWNVRVGLYYVEFTLVYLRYTPIPYAENTTAGTFGSCGALAMLELI